MTWPQVMSRIVIPQAVRCVIPTMNSEFVMLYKDTSPLSSGGVIELMLFSKNLTATTGNITPYGDKFYNSISPHSTIWL